jgi:hypothetical protein
VLAGIHGSCHRFEPWLVACVARIVLLFGLRVEQVRYQSGTVRSVDRGLSPVLTCRGTLFFPPFLVLGVVPPHPFG